MKGWMWWEDATEKPVFLSEFTTVCLENVGVDDKGCAHTDSPVP